MLATLKKLSAVGLAGAIVGAIIASLIAPRFIAWYVSPGAQGQALCNCPELARSVVGELLEAQLAGAGLGALLFIVVGVLVTRGRQKRTADGGPSSSASSSPS